METVTIEIHETYAVPAGDYCEPPASQSMKDRCRFLESQSVLVLGECLIYRCTLFRQRIDPRYLIEDRCTVFPKCERCLTATKRVEEQMTTAQEIASLLMDDGTLFETEDGITLDELAESKGGEIKRDGEAWSYIFEDGSQIYGNAAGWEIDL